MKIKNTDLLILSHLRQNARMKLTDFSRKTGLPVSTLFDAIHVFEERGVTRKHAGLFRFEDFGYRAKALISLSVRKSESQKLLQLLASCEHLNSLYRVSNGWDFLVEGVFLGMKEVEDFAPDIEEKVKLRSNKIFYIIDELKKKEFLNNLKKERLLRRLP